MTSTIRCDMQGSIAPDADDSPRSSAGVKSSARRTTVDHPLQQRAFRLPVVSVELWRPVRYQGFTLDHSGSSPGPCMSMHRGSCRACTCTGTRPRSPRSPHCVCAVIVPPRRNRKRILEHLEANDRLPTARPSARHSSAGEPPRRAQGSTPIDGDLDGDL